VSVPGSGPFDENGTDISYPLASCFIKDTTEYDAKCSNWSKVGQLINLAVLRFIKEPRTITFSPVHSTEFAGLAERVFKKHKHAMNKFR
jgi:hypothetical protein